MKAAIGAKLILGVTVEIPVTRDPPHRSERTRYNPEFLSTCVVGTFQEIRGHFNPLIIKAAVKSGIISGHFPFFLLLPTFSYIASYMHFERFLDFYYVRWVVKCVKRQKFSPSVKICSSLSNAPRHFCHSKG